MNHLAFYCSLIITLLFAAQPVHAAEPCPWQDDATLSAVCPRWDAMVRRLEAAQQRADTAEQSLNAMEEALAAMERAVKSLTNVPPDTPVGELPIVIAEAKTRTVADPEAQRVRAIIDDVIVFINNKMTPMAGRIELERDYALEPAADSDGYTATFQQAAVTFADIRIDFSPLQITVTPTPSADETLDFSMRVNNVIKGQQDGKTLFELRLGGQEINGSWSEKSKSMQLWHKQFDNMRLTSVDTDPVVAIALGQFVFDHDLAIDGDDNWQQKNTLILADLSFALDEERISLENIDSEIVFNGSEYSQLIALSGTLQNQLEDTAKGNQDSAAVIKDMGDFLSLFGNYSTTLNAYGLVMRTGEDVLAKIDRFNFANGLQQNTEQETTKFDYRIALDGIDSGLGVLPNEILPQQLRLEMVVDNIPARLAERLAEIGLSNADSDELPRQLMIELMSSKLQLDIIDTYIASLATRADIDAHAEVNPQSSLGATANILLRIEGLPTLIELSGLSQVPGVAPMLVMLGAFSIRTEENGQTIDSFDLSLTEEGRLMLNGKDVTAMFMPGADVK